MGRPVLHPFPHSPFPPFRPPMAHDTIEIYVRNLSEDDAADWLQEVFGAIEPVQEAPIVTYEVGEEAPVPVQIAEGVRGGPYTSLWFNAPDLPWGSATDCARAAHEAFGVEVLCYLDRPEEPWTLFRMAEGTEEHVDERELDDL